MATDELSEGSAAPADLETLLAPRAEALALGANRPLPLVGRSAWLIAEGQVEVFAVGPAEDGGGARSHIVTVEAGQMLFGLGAQRTLGGDDEGAGAGTGLIGVAHPGTRLLETPTGTLTRLARQPANVSLLETAIEGWVSGLFERLPRHAAPTRFTPLEAGAEVQLDGDGGVVRSAVGVVWVRHVAGSSAFLGRVELTVDAADRLVPIAEGTWLSSGEGTVLSCVATGHLLRSGTLWDGLRYFHELFRRHLALDLATSEDAARQRLEDRLELDRQTLRSAHASLASVLGGAPQDLSIRQAAEPLLAACQLVARQQGIELRLPLAGDGPALQAAAAERMIYRICDASRIRHRRVLLRDDWWRRDGGPLLAFLEQEEPAGAAVGAAKKTRRPVALLPDSPRSYEMVDPANRTRATVDARVSERLAGAAIMFYPPLPAGRVRFRDLLRLAFRGRRRDLLTVGLMGIGGGVLAIFVPLVTEQLFGQVIPGADRSQLLEMTLALVVAALGAAAFQVTRSIAVLRLSGKIDGSLQAAVWDRLLALPSAFFRRYTVGDLANRAMGIDAIRDLLVGNVTTAFLGLIFSVFSFVLLFYYSARLALLASALIALLVGVTTLFAYLQLRHQRVLLAIQGKIASVLLGLIHGLGKLRTSGAEKRAYALWAEHFTRQRQRTFSAQRLANAQATFSAVYGVASTLALFGLMGLALQNDLSISRFLAFSAAFGQVQAAALTLVSLVSGVLTMVPIYERLSPILEESPEVDESKLEAGGLSGDIELAHVSFRYHDEAPLVLADVSLRARPGEFIALVGPSGSGKSTCLRLLLGFERPVSGSIYFDGQDLASLDLQSVRRQIGVVLQNSRPMAGDIYSNIVGNSDLGIDAAWEAARMAGLSEDIEAMPMGMHTMISEGAGTFSGGQIQRLMIARAIVNRPRILIFDEATSALDNRTQQIVAESLERLKASRIVVAHRLSTIRNADRIYVVDAGRVVEEGKYEQLVAKNGLFARLAERQMV